MKNGRKRYNGKIALCFLFVIIALVLAPQKRAEGAGDSKNFANLVIFVKYHGDKADVFNASSGGYSNWQEIKKMYNTGNGQNYNNSFSNYILQVTEEKIKVNNLFPQERPDGTGVIVYELSVEGLDEHGVVSNVLEAINKGVIKVDMSQKMDHGVAGVLDNLTIIIQENKNPSIEMEAFHTRYAGDKRLGNLRVDHFNVIHSNKLVSQDGSLTVAAQQSVIAHEFLHTLGLPDLYRYTGNGEPVGLWDVMAKNFYYLQYPLSYLRARQNWITMGTIRESGTYTLTAVSEKGGNKVFALETPLSDTELICVEYRKKNLDPNQFEHKIPSSGLLMYRVDKNVLDLTNVRGDNYLYVYRPGVSDPEAASDVDANGMNLYWNAALDGTLGKGSYGSTDLDADFTKNTLYYSNGNNSGIRISDVTISKDQRELTFTVTFADYDKVDLWEKVGNAVGSAVAGDPCLYADPATGTLYMAHDENGASLLVKRWNGTDWMQLGAPIAGGRNPALAVCNGDLYLAYVRNSDNNVVFSKWSGNSWVSSVYAASAYYGVQFVMDGNELYGVYESEERLIIRDVKNGTVVTDSLKASDFGGSVSGQRSFGNPALTKLGNCFYMVCGVYPAQSQIMMYDIAGKKWSKVHSIASYSSNQHGIVRCGQKLYAYAGLQETGATLAVLDENGWSSRTLAAMKQAYSVSMEGVGDHVYLSYYDYADNKAKTARCTESSFEIYSDTHGTGLSYLGTSSQGGTIYMVMKQENAGYLTVRKKQVASGGGTPPSIQPVTSITLNKTAIVLNRAESFQLKASVYPSNANNKTVFWNSENEKVAKVDGNGLITAISEGTVKINAVAADGSGVSQSCTVKVTETGSFDNPVTKVSFFYPETLYVGGTYSPTVSVSPENAVNKTLTWTSSNPEIMAVDGRTGMITVRAAGTATITAKAHNGMSHSKTLACTMASGQYIGHINSELISFDLMRTESGSYYLTGQIVVVEWVDGQSTVPKTKPVMTFKSTDGRENIEVFVTATGTNTYYFDRFIEGLSLGREYVFEIASGDADNVSANRSMNVSLATSPGMVQIKNLGKIGEQKISYYMASNGEMRLYRRAKSYVGNINSQLMKTALVTGPNGNYVSGEIVVVEWEDGISTVPFETPIMYFKSTDGREILPVWVTPTGTNTYYFDRSLGELDPGKEYIFTIESGDALNSSQYRSMVVTTTGMSHNEGILWESPKQYVKYRTDIRTGQLRIYGVNK